MGDLSLLEGNAHRKWGLAILLKRKKKRIQSLLSGERIQRREDNKTRVSNTKKEREDLEKAAGWTSLDAIRKETRSTGENRKSVTKPKKKPNRKTKEEKKTVGKQTAIRTY